MVTGVDYRIRRIWASARFRKPFVGSELRFGSRLGKSTQRVESVILPKPGFAHGVSQNTTPSGFRAEVEAEPARDGPAEETEILGR